MTDHERDHRDHGDDAYAQPYFNPINHYEQLPEWKRQWIEDLRPDDIKEIEDARRFYHTINSAGRFVKWLAIVVVGIFVGAASLGDAIQKVFGWLFHAGHP